MHSKLTTLALLAGLGLSGAAQATLIDRGGGLIYDDVLNITWLHDANYAARSGGSGLMDWATANAWAAGLVYHDSVRNVDYDDWRLPNTKQPDPNCAEQYSGYGPVTLGAGYNCTGSEMGHLFYVDLGGTAGSNILTSGDPDLAKFINIQARDGWDVYFSGTDIYLDGLGTGTLEQWVWSFDMTRGELYAWEPANTFSAWAVRDGDVAAVPEPATFGLFALGLLFLGASRTYRITS